MYLTLTLPETYVGDVRADLREALDGHRYAWRSERNANRSLSFHIVATAAGTSRDERGRRERYSDHEKSTDRLNDKFDDAFGMAADLEVRGFAHGIAGAARHLVRLTRAGEFAAETSDAKFPSVRDRDSVWTLATSWKHALRSQEQRDVAHIIISSKPGTDQEAFVGAARAMLAREFPHHEYAFALHRDKEHLHVHAVVRMRDRDGERLHPNISDFHRWRETMAHEARERNIAMEAVSRFDQAHAPGEKLWERRAMERGTASERVRRRVEAVRSKAIHVPTREEGKRRAVAAGREWAEVAMNPPAPREAPIAESMTRLYRPEQWPQPSLAARGPRLFSTDRGFAERAATKARSPLYSVDVTDRAANFLEHPGTADPVVFVPAELRTGLKPVDSPAGMISRIKDRVEIANARAQTQNRPEEARENTSMASANLRRKLDHHKHRTAERAGELQGAAREAFLKEATAWEAEAENDIERVRAAERERARVHIGVIKEIGTIRRHPAARVSRVAPGQ
jgi:hypothetical protein